jgi:dipeptidyl aminopeptidase/acylaminoacyl peptidase
MSRVPNNVRTFVVITVACVVVSVIYTLFSAREAQSSAGSLTSAPIVPPPFAEATTPSPLAAPTVPSPLAAPIVSPEGHPAAPTERIYFAAGNGICLTREIKFFSAQTIATLVDATFRPLFSVRTDGIPTRARISPDGRHAAFTVFVTGHSYADAQLSTTTLLVDIANRATLANLEEFEVLQDGSAIKSPDFNYWGVTFEHDSNFFYATLRTGGVNYLVHGDIKAKRVTIVHKGVECPSLSPDGTRIAFKKMISRGDWRVAVLNLTTFEETHLPETRSVDDQVEWLDNERLLYALVDPAPWMSIMVVSADGSGQPKGFAKGAASPAVVRQFRQ